jgi:hypothetical protein
MSGLTISHGTGRPLTLTKEFIEERLSNGINIRLQNNFGGSSVTETFKIINTADSVKDGISTKLSQEIYSPEKDDVAADNIKTHMKRRLDQLIETGEARRTMYHRVKGTAVSDYVSNISCTQALLDCGAHPDKLLPKNVKADLKSTIGSFIDTGPGETTLNNTFPDNCDINEDIMSLLGYDNSSIKRDRSSFVMKLAGVSYPTTPDTTGRNIKEELALGNVRKNALIKLSSTLKERKTALVYYKSLGDKSLAFFYMLYWLYLNHIGERQILCLFTCDMFTSLYCLVFGVSFVFNTNEFENGAKVTGVYHWTPDPIDWEDLIRKEGAQIIKDYNKQIGLLNSIIDEDIFFTGEEDKVYSRRRNFIQLLIDKMTESSDKVKSFLGGIDPVTLSQDDYERIKSYKPIILFNKNKNSQNMFVTTKKRVCVADGGNIDPGNKTIREICIRLTGPAGGGIKATKQKRKNKITPRAVLVGGMPNHIGYNFDLDDAIKDLEQRCNSIYYSIIRQLRVPDFFAYVIPDDSLIPETDLFFTRDTNCDYDYGSIYDEVTYYLYANPDYSDANLFAVITNILESYVDNPVQLYQAAAIVANERVLKASRYADQYERTSIANSKESSIRDVTIKELEENTPPDALTRGADTFASLGTTPTQPLTGDSYRGIAERAAQYDEQASKMMDAVYAHRRTAEDNHNAYTAMSSAVRRLNPAGPIAGPIAGPADGPSAGPIAGPIDDFNASDNEMSNTGEVSSDGSPSRTPPYTPNSQASGADSDMDRTQNEWSDSDETGSEIDEDGSPVPLGALPFGALLTPPRRKRKGAPAGISPGPSQQNSQQPSQGSQGGIFGLFGGGRKHYMRITKKKCKYTKRCIIRKDNKKSKKVRKNKKKKTRRRR